VLRLDGESIREAPLFACFWRLWKKHQIDKAEVDFNHLLWFTYELFRAHPKIVGIYRQAYKYVLVDEFQDTNPIQFSILSLLAGTTDDQSEHVAYRRPVFIFADDWQSIYGFLGAIPKRLMTEAKRAFGCREVELAEDHRTTSPALSLFGRLLRRSRPTRIGTQDLDIPLFILSNPGEMAKEVVAQVGQWVDHGIPLHEIAILARNRWQLERVKALLSHDFLSVPDLKAAGLETLPVFTVLTRLSKGEPTRYGNLRRILESHTLDGELEEGQEYIRLTILSLAGNYDLRYPAMGLKEKARLMANEALLEINWGRRFQQLCRDRIFVGTLHSVKGLEFRAVAIVHLDRDSFPYWRFVCKYCKGGQRRVDESIEEEWRVFYVGVTRAIERLALFSSATNDRGYSTPAPCLVRPPIWGYLDVVDRRDGHARMNDIRCTLHDDFS
jgi:superfamily I DNA/RNA helicase